MHAKSIRERGTRTRELPVTYQYEDILVGVETPTLAVCHIRCAGEVSR